MDILLPERRKNHFLRHSLKRSLFTLLLHILIFTSTSAYSENTLQWTPIGGDCPDGTYQNTIEAVCDQCNIEEVGGPFETVYWKMRNEYGGVCYHIIPPGPSYYGGPLESGYVLFDRVGECSPPHVLDKFTGKCLANDTEANSDVECPVAGNPIGIFSGNKHHKEIDYEVQENHASKLRFERFYNSSFSFEGAVGQLDELAYQDTALGVRWRHSYSSRVDGYIHNTPDLAIVYRPNGRRVNFNLIGNNWIAGPDVKLQLTELVDASQNRTGWQLHLENNDVEIYNVDGKLISIESINGHTQALVYDQTTGGLLSVNDDFGNSLTFTYNSNGRLATMTDPDGNDYSYDYARSAYAYSSLDRSNNLVSVILPDSTPLENTDNPKRQYLYENTNFPNALTGIIDEKGIRFATWVYDSEGRAISSQHANGTEFTTLDYANLNNATDPRVTVTNALGKDTTYHAIEWYGVKKVSQVEGHPSANCAGANSSIIYDANGFEDIVTDWEGNITDYDYDARGLEVQRVEAKNTPEQRMITTQWHSTFRLPTKITEPDRVIDFTYDANGRLIQRKDTPVTAP